MKNAFISAVKIIGVLIFIIIITRPVSSQYRSGNADLWCLEFLDEMNGITIGEAGTIRRTTDGGESWYEMNSGVLVTLRKTSIMANDHIVVAGLNGTMIKSTDLGTTWESKPSGVSTDLYGICFGGRLSEVGIAVGNNETILRSTDQGDSWITIMSGDPSSRSKRFTAVSFANENTGIVAGDKGTILLTSNGGETWYRSSSDIPYIDFRFVIMLDEFTAYATGNNGTIIKTSDGGESWSSMNTGTSSDLYRIRFADDQIAFSDGADGTILKTTNGGLTWDQVNSGITTDLTCMFVCDDLVTYAGGEGGTIIKTTDGGESWTILDMSGRFLSNSEKMSSQLSSYPNPSNPYTNINYSIGSFSNVTIKIFDILGKEVKTLVSGAMEKGKYSILFNGAELSSGMYFCKMTVSNNYGNTTKTMKIILVK